MCDAVKVLIDFMKQDENLDPNFVSAVARDNDVADEEEV